jgi:hypothetical protein
LLPGGPALMSSFAELAVGGSRARLGGWAWRPSRPVVIAAATLVVYSSFVVGSIAHGSSASSFAFVGRDVQPATSTLARYAPSGHTAGYDGQYALFIALDPVGARPSLDDPAYRYSHILYPLLARVVALDRPAFVPAALLIVNLIAVALGAYAVARVLERRGASPWLAFLVAFYPGMFLSVARDLNEPVAFAALALGLLVLDWASPRRVVAAASVFAAAGLARETTLLFPLILAAWEAWRSRRVWLPAVLGLSALPYAVWSAVLLVVLPVAGGRPGLARYPLQGAIAAPQYQLFQWVFVVAPLLLTAVVLATTALTRPTTAFTLLLGAEILLSSMLGPASFGEWTSSSRLQLGVLLAALLARPQLRARPLQLAAAALVFAPAVPVYLIMFAQGPGPR